jgi:hypothetical protein
MTPMTSFLMLAVLMALGTAPLSAQQATGALDRAVLPILEPRNPPITERMR